MDSQNEDIIKEKLFFELDRVTGLLSKLSVYPFVNKTKKTVGGFIAMCIFLCITIFQLAASLIISKFEDWFEIINIAPNLGVCALILIKYAKMHTNAEIYEQFMTHFKYDLWNVVDMKSKKHIDILQRYIRVSRHILLFQYYYTISLVVIVLSFPRIVMFIDSSILGNEIQYLYPFNGWYPFDKIKWYNAIYVWESFMTAVVVCLYVFSNMMYLSFTRHVCMELKILGSSMEDIVSSRDNENITRKVLLRETLSNIKHRLKTIIKRHQKLIGMIGEFERILGSGLLLIYLFGSVFICLTILTALMVDDLYMSLRYFCFFFSLLIEVFIQCIIGQLLIDHSEELEQAIYFCDWCYTDKETKQMLVIFLIRAQRPLKLSAMGYLTMNLTTFGGVCSLSYQFFNLLRTVFFN